MPLSQIAQYPERISLSNELHARPFPKLNTPSRAACIAIERDSAAPDADRTFLLQLLDHYGVSHPAPSANHHTADLGRTALKWERHSEFCTFTLYVDGLTLPGFSGEVFEHFPKDWLASAPGRLLSSTLVRIEHAATAAEVESRIDTETADWFVRESRAVSYVSGGSAAVASDFRLDENANIRFAVYMIGDTLPHRTGRTVQRLIEIETYKSMAMLTLPVARHVFGEMVTLDQGLSEVVTQMSKGEGSPEQTLDTLLDISARIEMLSAEAAFRFSSAEAYSAIVNQRIDVLNETPLMGGLLIGEFMTRRFAPAMRTCQSANERLSALSRRATRASRLLGTRVNVLANEQNQRLLKQMDKRALQQFHLQQTVEGLSVFAISYYAVNLLTKLLTPGAISLGLSEKWLGASLVPPVLLVVWLVARRISKAIHKDDDR